MKEVLELYCRLSGQAVNDSKLAIMFSSNPLEILKCMVTDVFSHNQDIKLDNYLGMPLEWGRSKVDAFQYLVRQMHVKAQS
ncbi:hypothetical protein LINPERPRIM_LOCUS16951 [Linum perenne]